MKKKYCYRYITDLIKIINIMKRFLINGRTVVSEEIKEHMTTAYHLIPRLNYYQVHEVKSFTYNIYLSLKNSLIFLKRLFFLVFSFPRFVATLLTCFYRMGILFANGFIIQHFINQTL